MPKVRILLVTQLFDPEPTFKGLVFARELVRRGYEVEVATGFPNYPGGKIYRGYRIKLLQRETIDGVRIARLPLFPSHSQSKVGRVLNYGSFAVSVVFFGLFGAGRPDVIYAYHPPITVGVAASIIRFFRRVPLVYDIQDIWPDTLRATGMFSSELGLRAVSWICDWTYKQADYLVVLSPGFKSLLIQRGVPESKIDIIYNWCDETSICASVGKFPPYFPLDGKFRILFAGNMGKAQALEAVLNAAALIQEREPSLVFVLLGGGVELARLKLRADNMKLRNVVFLPPVPMGEVGPILQSADVLLVHLKKDPLFEITIPSKTQAYMAAGKPILMAVSGDAAGLVQESSGGVIAVSEEPESLAAAAMSLMRMQPESRLQMARNGRNFYLARLSLNVGVGKFCQIFSRLISR